LAGRWWIPKLYMGGTVRFSSFATKDGATVRRPESYVVPTAAELSGDFPSSILNQNIYDPATTQPDPSNPGSLLA